MVVITANALAIALVAFLVLHFGKDLHVAGKRSARWLEIAGLIPLALQVSILLLFGIGEIASGDFSGVSHFLPVVATVLLALLAWIRPLEGGAALLIVGIVTSISFSEAVAVVIMAAPQIVSGLLFLLAGIVGRSVK